MGKHFLKRAGFKSLKLSACFLSTMIAACSIHPLPEDVTPLNTYEIVNKIRCEARSAIKKRGVALLQDDNQASPADAKYWSEYLDQNTEKWKKIPLHKFSKRTRLLIEKYDGAYVSFDFTFRITEENNVSTDISLLRTLKSGTDGLGIKASNNRTRKNTRNFRVKDEFGKLLMADLTCEGVSRAKDYLYPVTGEIGVKEVIWTFLDLNEAQSLTKSESTRLMADTLVFTTAIVGSVAPKIILSPIGKALNLSEIGFNVEVKRTDEHEVLIGLSLPDDVNGPISLSEPDGPVALAPSVRVGLSKAPNLQSYQLDQFMNYQLDRNALLNLRDARPINISILP